MSRSDLGMFGILGLAGLGFFVFTAREDERAAKEKKDRAEALLANPDGIAEVAPKLSPQERKGKGSMIKGSMLPSRDPHTATGSAASPKPEESDPVPPVEVKPPVEPTPEEKAAATAAAAAQLAADEAAALASMNVPFPAEFSTAGVKPEKIDDAQVAVLIKRFAECPGGRVSLVGHTDGHGGGDRNKYISLERARAVSRVLVRAGMKESLIETSGAGASIPTAPNADTMGRHFNRRVDMRCGQEAAK